MVTNPAQLILSQLITSGVWMGTQESLTGLLSCLVGKVDMQLGNADMHSETLDNDPPLFGGKYHYMMNKYHDVAVIDVRGTLITYESPYNKYFGVVSYEEIRNSVAMAVKDKQVSTILMKFDTGGGTAKGVDECCEFLQKVNKEHLPIYSLVNGTMASAGYFIGSVGKKIFTTKLSMVGSIGTIVPIWSYFRMLEEQGIDVQIVRSPEFKALGHPLDPMSETALKDMQKTVDTLTEVFEGYVAENRATSVEVVQSRYGQGRVFVGQDSVNKGLADEVSTFDAVINRLRTSDNSNFV